MSTIDSGPVLITGVNGFIARHLAEHLRARGVAVRGTVRRPDAAAGLDEDGIDGVRASLADRDRLAEAAQGCRAIVHAAAWTGGPEVSPEAGYAVNVDGTANVLAAARAAGVGRIVYLSSVAVYGLNRARLLDERASTPRVGQAYPDSKIVAEALVRESGLPYVIVRPASTYGPRGDAWTLGPIGTIRAGRLVLLGRDDGLVTPGYIDNVVGGLWLTLTEPAALGETFNLCDDRAVTYRQFYLAYAGMLGQSTLPTVPQPVAWLARLPAARWARRALRRRAAGRWSQHFRFNPSQYSIAHAVERLGYAPTVSFEEGMRRTELWLRATGHLS